MYGDTDNPDRLYDEVIMPYKGELERWYVNHQTLGNYFLLILLTVLVVLCPHSRVLWRVFPDLPRPPAELQDKIPGPW
jgi:hypothetical protein